MKTRPEKLVATIRQRGGMSSGELSSKGFETARNRQIGLRADPWPCNSPEQLALLRKLEERFLCARIRRKVGIGVATGNDGVFITKDAGSGGAFTAPETGARQGYLGRQARVVGSLFGGPVDQRGAGGTGKVSTAEGVFREAWRGPEKTAHGKNNRAGWYKTIDRVTHALTESRSFISLTSRTLSNRCLIGAKHILITTCISFNPTHGIGSARGIAHVGHRAILCGLLWRPHARWLSGGFRRNTSRRIRVPDPKTISNVDAKKLVEAFRQRDRKRATQTALEFYGVTQPELESAIGY